MPGDIILIIVIIAIALILGVMLGSIYNSLVRLDVKAKEAWSGITVQLKRRADLIPNLVNAVKGYAAHEAGVFEKVTEARSAVVNATDHNSPKEAAQAENMLTETLKSLFAVAEAYPDLKASGNFQDLQNQLADTEDKISASRRFYNSAVNGFNAKRRSFPAIMFASMFGFKQDKEFFEVDEAEQQAIQKPTEVSF